MGRAFHVLILWCIRSNFVSALGGNVALAWGGDRLLSELFLLVLIRMPPSSKYLANNCSAELSKVAKIGVNKLRVDNFGKEERRPTWAAWVLENLSGTENQGWFGSCAILFHPWLMFSLKIHNSLKKDVFTFNVLWIEITWESTLCGVKFESRGPGTPRAASILPSCSRVIWEDLINIKQRCNQLV